MLTKEEFDHILDERQTLIIDGALATELENRGYDLNDALWSAKILGEDPNAIKQVHLDYFLAGADVAITASYQASVQGLTEHCEINAAEAIDLIKLGVQLAQQAREEAYARGVPRSRRLLVTGSVGPYGAYLADGSEYRGDYQRTLEEFQAFHRPRIAALIDAGADLLALETMPSLGEIQAILSLLAEEFPKATAWLSCTVRDAEHLSDGSSLSEVAKVAAKHSQQVVALGVNCVPIDVVSGALSSLDVEWRRPLLCYPNSGEVYDGISKTWSGNSSHRGLVRHVIEWKAIGARLIGGCCRTNPEDIRNITGELQSR